MKVTISCPQLDEKLNKLEKLVKEVNDIAKALNPSDTPLVEVIYKIPEPLK